MVDLGWEVQTRGIRLHSSAWLETWSVIAGKEHDIPGEFWLEYLCWYRALV